MELSILPMRVRLLRRWERGRKGFEGGKEGRRGGRGGMRDSFAALCFALFFFFSRLL